MKFTSKLGYFLSLVFIFVAIVLVLAGWDFENIFAVCIAGICVILAMVAFWTARYKELEERRLLKQLTRRESDKRSLNRTLELLVYLDENNYKIEIGDEAIYVESGEKIKVTTTRGEEKIFLATNFVTVELDSQYMLVSGTMLISFLYGKENSALVFYKK